MNLMIIEGPGKIDKITKLLGSNWKVMATSGHIEKLKDSDYDNTGISKTFDLNFEFIDYKIKLMDEINEYALKAEFVYIATDLDREGEGIAWHIWRNLKDKSKSKRITFNEISEKAIQKAIQSPREIDMDYVHAYFARVILDKKIGYGLSKFLRKSVDLKSAGRVQSPGLKLVYENHQIRENFNSISTYKIKLVILGVGFNHTSSVNEILVSDDFKFNSIELAKKFITEYLPENSFICTEINIKEKYVSPLKPFETSTALNAISKALGVKVDVATSILQKLYEKGHTNYPRTDSTRFSEDFCLEGYEYVKNLFGDLSSNEFSFNKSGGGDQDAHEGIRVSHLDFTPENMEQEFEEDSLKKAYKIIYDNTIIQFMKKQKLETNEVIIKNKDGNELFSFSFNKEIFKGFNEYVKKEYSENYDFKVGDVYLVENFDDMSHLIKTQPPALYDSMSLVEKLKLLGVGRPSTFSSIIKSNEDRGYFVINEKGKLIITESGIIAIESLQKSFSSYIEYDFTDKMESSLDEIKNGKLNYLEYLKKYIDSFELELKKHNFEKVKFGDCPTCKSDTHQLKTKAGDLVEVCSKRIYDSKLKTNSGCSFIKFPEKLPNFINRKCPKDNGKLISINNPKGKNFIKCENGKYDAKTKKSSGCKYVEFEK